MRTVSLLLALALLTSLRLNAQHPVDTTGRKLVRDVFVSAGGLVEGGGWVTRGEVLGGAPGSTMLQGGLPDHTFEHGPAVLGGGLLHASIGLTLKENRAKGSSMKLRTGLGMAWVGGASSSFERTERFPYDTLTSSGSGGTLYADSVSRSTYDIRHTHQRIGLDIDLLFVKDFPGHWMLYGGAGVSVGTTLGGITRVEHRTSRYIETLDNGRDQGVYVTEDESVRTSGVFFTNIHVPLGVGFRFARRNPFWRSLVLTWETRPGITIGGEPTNTPGPRPGISFLLGMRVDLAR